MQEELAPLCRRIFSNCLSLATPRSGEPKPPSRAKAQIEVRGDYGLP